MYTVLAFLLSDSKIKKKIKKKEKKEEENSYLTVM
jgi:hypothetical protein